MRYPGNVVTAEDTRAKGAGRPDKCFYCEGPTGGEHEPSCVCLDRPRPEPDDSEDRRYWRGRAIQVLGEHYIEDRIEWYPDTLTLDLLHEAEAKLTDEQRRHYAILMYHSECKDRPTTNPIEDCFSGVRFNLLHAPAEKKIRALAAVLAEWQGGCGVAAPHPLG